jgi:hypothetical protein
MQGTLNQTVSVSVTSASWQTLAASLALPNGLLLGTNQELCVLFRASTTSGTPTVTLGTSTGHYTSVNGPWIKSGANSLQ